MIKNISRNQTKLFSILPGSELILQALLCVFSIVGYWQCFVSAPLPGLTHAWVCRARFLSTALLILFPDQVYDGDFLSMIPGSARLCNFLFGTLLLSDTGVIARLKLSVLFCFGGIYWLYWVWLRWGGLVCFLSRVICSYLQPTWAAQENLWMDFFLHRSFTKVWQNGNYSY